MTASPSGPTPCKRYTVRWDRVLLALNLAGVIRSGTTRSGLSRRHAWTAGWARRTSRRRAEGRPVGAGGGGGAGGTGGHGPAGIGHDTPALDRQHRRTARHGAGPVADDDHGAAFLE